MAQVSDDLAVGLMDRRGATAVGGMVASADMNGARGKTSGQCRTRD